LRGTFLPVLAHYPLRNLCKIKRLRDLSPKFLLTFIQPSPSSREISFRMIPLMRSPGSPAQSREEVDISKKRPR